MSTVLVVDDEPDVRLMARVVLTSAGYDVTEAGSGEEALEQLANVDGPDVMLLDVRMPGINGWEVLRRIRDNPAAVQLPIVVFTADMSALQDAPVAFDENEFFIAKPFDPDDLVALIGKALDS